MISKKHQKQGGKKMKIRTILFGIIALILLSQPALAELYMEQTIISNGSVSHSETIYSEGDVVSEHSIFGEGNVDLIVNGIEWDPHTVGESIISIESQMVNDNIEEFKGNDLSVHIKRAISFLIGEIPSTNPVSEQIAKALYKAFMTRYEIAQMYESLDARLAVWEKWAELYDHERYCHAKAMVAQERGYEDFHCHEDEWYHIKPDYTEGIRVEPFPFDEEIE